MIGTFHVHRPKTITFLELWHHEEWNIKLYGIYRERSELDQELVKMAKSIARRTLPQPALTGDRYGMAFVTIHPSSMFNQIIVDWWERENELRHRVFKANPETPLSFHDITPSGEAFCIWELKVIAFERDAWTDTILRNAASCNFSKYLAQQLNEVT